MIEPGEGLGFTAEVPDEVRVLGHVLSEQLHRDGRLALLVECEVNVSHPAAADEVL